MKVRGNVAKSRHAQWWLGNKVRIVLIWPVLYYIIFQTPKDTERLESIISMIDTWSMAYSCMLLVVGILQLSILKRFFVVTPITTQFKIRI